MQRLGTFVEHLVTLIGKKLPRGSMLLASEMTMQDLGMADSILRRIQTDKNFDRQKILKKLQKSSISEGLQSWIDTRGATTAAQIVAIIAQRKQRRRDRH